MARIRTIKPTFWTAEQVMECSPLARLLFIGMWNFCDDRGVHPASAKTLKAEVFPADDCTAAQVAGWVQELIDQGLLIEFEADSRRWWSVTGWHHQLINRPTPSRYPEPPRLAPPPSAAGLGPHCSELVADQSEPSPAAENSASSPPVAGNPHGALTEDSRRTHGGLTERSLQEGKGKEGKGKEGERISFAPSADALEAAEPPNDLTAISPLDVESAPTPAAAAQDADSTAIVRIPLNDKTERAITAAEVAEMIELYPAVDVMSELGKMRGWCLGNPAKRKTKTGVMRFVHAWLAKAQDQGPKESPRSAGRQSAGALTAARAAPRQYERGNASAVDEAIRLFHGQSRTTDENTIDGECHAIN